MGLEGKTKHEPRRRNRFDVSVLEYPVTGIAKRTGTERCPFLFLSGERFVIRLFVSERKTDIHIGRSVACVYRFGNSLRNTEYNLNGIDAFVF